MAVIIDQHELCLSGMKTSYSRWLRACFSCTSRSNCIRFSIAFDWDDVFVISDLAKMRSSLEVKLKAFVA
jgi:hypothetical protein